MLGLPILRKSDQHKLGSSSKLITSWFQENESQKTGGFQGCKKLKKNTLPKTNIGHKSCTMAGDYFPFGKAVLFRGELFALGRVNTTCRQLKLSLSNQFFSHVNLIVCKAWNSLNHSTTLPKTKSSHLKMGHPERKFHLPTIHCLVFLFLASGSVGSMELYANLGLKTHVPLRSVRWFK